MEKKQYKISFSPSEVYLICSLTGIVLFFIAAFFLHQTAFDWADMENNSDWDMLDYFRHIFFAGDLSKLYSQKNTDTIFPPLAYLFYHFICTITRGEKLPWFYSDLPDEPYQITVYIMYLILGVVWLSWILEELPCSVKNRRLLLVSFLLSAPMYMGALERGNMAFYVLLMLLTALIWKDSPSMAKRELALVFIAVAAAFKIYPVVFGLLYLKEKRWKEAGRLTAYGVLLFFLPFALTGGPQSITLYFQKLSELTSGDYNGRVQFIGGLLATAGITGTAAAVITAVFALLLLAGAFLAGDAATEMIFLGAFMALVPKNAYRYTLIYFFPVVFCLFRDGKKGKNEYFTAVMLGCVFSLPTVYGILTGFRLNFDMYTLTCVEVFLYALVWIAVVVQLIRTAVRCCRGRKQHA